MDNQVEQATNYIAIDKGEVVSGAEHLPHLNPGYIPQPIEHPAVKLPLGDYTEGVLKKMGVTPDRYKKVKELFGMAPTCGCDKRKEWLNRVGSWLATIGDTPR